MSKIVFAIPPLSLEERYGSLGKGGVEMPAIGVLCLASICIKNHFDVSIVDSPAFDYDFNSAAENILEQNPDYIGISSTTVSISNAANLAQQLVQKGFSKPIILGGPHVSAVPIETMKRFPQFTVGVVGEGENTIIELLQVLNNESDLLSGVKGLVVKNGDEVKLTPPRTPIKDLDELPLPAWELLPPLDSYKLSATRFSKTPVGSILTSRGCYAKCTFCDTNVFGRTIRGHSPEYVIKMIEDLVQRFDIKSLIINDDTFAYDKKRLFTICEMMIEKKINIEWSCSSRINLMTPKALQIMRKAGCFQIAYGIESGSQTILDFLKKDVKLEKIQKTLEWTREAGIRSKGYFMIGIPGDTKETIEQTITFSKKIELDDFQVTFCTPFPGTELYGIAEHYGDFEDKWEKMNMWDIVFVPKGLSKKDLTIFSKRAFSEFYFRPRVIFSYIKMVFNNPLFIKYLMIDFFYFIKFIFLNRKTRVLQSD